MAQRRMFSKKIVETDYFMEMSPTAKLFYFYLNMSADDDGFVGNPKMIKMVSGATDDDFKILVAKQFILLFESGVIVVKDWRIHNYIQKDRYNKTQYTDEKSQLIIEENGTYTKCIQDGYGLDTQVRLGKDRLGKDSIVEESVGDDQHPHQKNEFQEIIKFYNENISPVTPFVREEIEFDCKDFGYELVQEALRRTVLNSKTSYKYSQAILRDWKSKNYKTLDDVEAELKRNINQQNNTSNQDSSQYDGIF